MPDMWIAWAVRFLLLKSTFVETFIFLLILLFFAVIVLPIYIGVQQGKAQYEKKKTAQTKAKSNEAAKAHAFRMSIAVIYRIQNYKVQTE